MQFNDTANRQGLIQDCELWTGIGTDQISGNTNRLKEFTRLINDRYRQVVTMILEAQNEWDFDDTSYSNYPILTTNLVKDQQDYQLPTSPDLLKVQRAEITYDGDNWYNLEPFDLNSYDKPTDSDSIDSDFSQSAPRYDTRYGAVFLYPVPDASVSGGLKLWILRDIDEFESNDTTKEPAIDKPFHRMLSLGASVDWAVSKGRSNAANLSELFNDMEQRLRTYYEDKEEHRPKTIKPKRETYR